MQYKYSLCNDCDEFLCDACAMKYLNKIALDKTQFEGYIREKDKETKSK